MCSRTCRDLHPYERDLWCNSCHRDEEEDREANMRRWQEAKARHKEFAEWTADQQEEAL